jgi:Na+/H+ antiporter NhaA
MSPPLKDKMTHHLGEFVKGGKAGKIALTHTHLDALDNIENEVINVQTPLQKLEHSLHSFVTFFVMPVFAFANAGVSFEGTKVAEFFGSLSLNIEISFVCRKSYWHSDFRPNCNSV